MPLLPHNTALLVIDVPEGRRAAGPWPRRHNPTRLAPHREFATIIDRRAARHALGATSCAA